MLTPGLSSAARVAEQSILTNDRYKLRSRYKPVTQTSVICGAGPSTDAGEAGLKLGADSLT